MFNNLTLMFILESKRIVLRVIVDKKDKKMSFGLRMLTRSLSLLRKIFELLSENLKTVRLKLPVSELFLLFTGLSNDFDAAAF